MCNMGDLGWVCFCFKKKQRIAGAGAIGAAARILGSTDPIHTLSMDMYIQLDSEASGGLDVKVSKYLPPG